MIAGNQAAARALARAALVGNPSDGFGGRTIALTLRERSAQVVIEPAADGRLKIADAEAAELIEATVARFARAAGVTWAECGSGYKPRFRGRSASADRARS